MQFLNPREALNKAYLKIKPIRVDFENFTSNLLALLEHKETSESEEFQKNLISRFLKDAFYGNDYFINTRHRSDLVIHEGSGADSPVGVIFEIKSVTNRLEMPSREKPNTKACHELLLYYLRERVSRQNLNLKHLIVTNLVEWFIFDAREFERLFAADKDLVKLFMQFEDGRLSGNRTDFFYEQVAKPHFQAVQDQLTATFFDLSAYEPPLGSQAEDSEKKLIPLFKVFSSTHLLKLPFVNDSQTLNLSFYSELLYILGLQETKSGSKKLIKRYKVGSRKSGSILENTIEQLVALNKISRLKHPSRFGSSDEVREFNVALELVITWVNRLIFLKLLEAQLIAVHGSPEEYRFLVRDKLNSFDDLNALYFTVLAIPELERSEEVKSAFPNVPYLNSSLFDASELEHSTIFISNLRDNRSLPLHPKTVLADSRGRRRQGNVNSLHYLLEFLDAYDFGAEAGEEILDQRKTLISASVLGLIFEKINGYKDGSFFTPGSITMYLSRQSVRQAVLDRFNLLKGWNCPDLISLYNNISDKAEANEIINGIRICDPAVGSGHFLVSALNELIAIKSELKIIADRHGRLLRDYEIEVVNDELIISDDDGSLFQYDPTSTSSQSIQEALFNEKRTLIENCLFGVDINPNSVRICRLRLWIELLKSAFYVRENGRKYLETLPNIDINIKRGNSLVSRFPVESGLTSTSYSRNSISRYREAVKNYQESTDRAEKRELERVIQEIKAEFSKQVYSTLLENWKGELRALEEQGALFDEPAEIEAKKKVRIRTLQENIDRQEQTAKDLVGTDNFNWAFEWRIEFPQLLDPRGNYRGFDLIIGNPPYGVSIKGALRNYITKTLGKVPDFEIYYMFLNLAHRILAPKGLVAFIIPNTFLFNVHASNYRLGILQNWQVNEIVDCTDFKIFADATVLNALVTWRKDGPSNHFGYKTTANRSTLLELLAAENVSGELELLKENNQNWALVFKRDPAILRIASSIRAKCIELETQFPEISQGLIAYDKYQGTDEKTIETRGFHSDRKIDASYKKWLRGEDVKRFRVEWNGTSYIKYGEKGEELANPRDPRFFRGSRLLVREITSPHIYAAISVEELYNDPAVIIVRDHGSSKITLDSLQGILNSDLATFYHLNSSPKITKGAFPKILVEDVKKFPLPLDPDPQVESKVAQFSKQIFENLSTSPDADTTELRQQLNRQVFKLYEITDEEQKGIEDWLAEYLAR